jgi:RNA polymerase sigma-70 factor (ECF subfamily)
VAVRADDVDLQRDAALVERFQTGDEAAFTDLYERYFNRLRRFCLRQLRDPHDAEEATQEALLRAYRALPRLSGDRHFYPWLRVIASNLCADMRRRRSPLAFVEPDGGDAVVDSLFDVLDHEQVRAVLEGLNPRHQTALSLWAEGYPSRHIADELGCSRGAADVTLYRARQSFRRRFLALDNDDRHGAVGGLGIVSAAVHWAQRMRVRVSARIGEHPELTSPLVTKLAAGAIAFGVVGGSLGAAGAAPSATPRLPAVVRVANVTAANDVARSPVAAPAASPATHTTPTPPTSSARSTPAASAPGRSLGPAHFKGYDEVRREGSKAPIYVDVAGAGVSVDPKEALQYATDVVNNRRAQ